MRGVDDCGVCGGLLGVTGAVEVDTGEGVIHWPMKAPGFDGVLFGLIAATGGVTTGGAEMVTTVVGVGVFAVLSTVIVGRKLVEVASVVIGTGEATGVGVEAVEVMDAIGGMTVSVFAFVTG